MNSKEDTLWLAELSENTLLEARIWPTIMLKIVNVLGITFTVLSLAAASSYLWTPVAALGLLIGYLLSKAACYKADIRLINNELMRRRQI